MKTISVLIPAYNAANFIEEALDSVAYQLRLPDELIIVDDGSSDNTYEIATQWLAKHSELNSKIIRQQNKGASAARNKAVESSSKEYIAFLDADDVLLPHHLDILIKGVESCEECVIAFGDQEVFSEDHIITKSFLIDKPVLNLPYQAFGDFRLITSSLWPSLIRGSYIPNGANLIKRESMLAVGGFDDSLGTSEDRHLFLKLSRVGKIGYFNTVIGRRRLHSSNLTHEDNSISIAKNAVFAIEKVLNDAAALKLSDDEVLETKHALNSALDNYIYFASCKPFFSYFRVWYGCIKKGYFKYLFSIKPFLRSFRYGLF